MAHRIVVLVRFSLILVLYGRQKPVADAIGIDESTISRWKGKGGHVEQFCRFLAELGIQLAPPGAVLVRRDYLFSVETLADIGMKAVRMQPEPLGWD